MRCRAFTLSDSRDPALNCPGSTRTKRTDTHSRSKECVRRPPHMPCMPTDTHQSFVHCRSAAAAAPVDKPAAQPLLPRRSRCYCRHAPRHARLARPDPHNTHVCGAPRGQQMTRRGGARDEGREEGRDDHSESTVAAFTCDQASGSDLQQWRAFGSSDMYAVRRRAARSAHPAAQPPYAKFRRQWRRRPPLSLAHCSCDDGEELLPH